MTFCVIGATDQVVIIRSVYLVNKVLKHAKACKASGDLMVPELPSAAFWTVTVDSGEKFRDFYCASVKIQ